MGTRDPTTNGAASPVAAFPDGRSRGGFACHYLQTGPTNCYGRAVLNRDAKVRLLKNVPFFSVCSKAELEGLSKSLRDVNVAEGTDIVREGDETREFYVIVSGTADVFQKGTLIRSMGPGEFFGEVSNLFHARRSATVTTTSDVHLLVSDEPGFFDVIHGTRGLHRKVIDAVAERITPAAL